MSRLDLHKYLLNIARQFNFAHVYFNPDSMNNVQYPCIMYSRKAPYTQKADNTDYISHDHYVITVISKDPDSEVPKAIKSGLFHCSITDEYPSNGFYHVILTCYYK